MSRAGLQRTKPTNPRAIRLRVLARQQISPSFVRVTLSGPELAHLTPLDHDQWFRFFLPQPGEEQGLDRLPDTMSTIAYARYRAIPAAVRPVLRNYTVRALRAAGTAEAELDVDIVLHGDGEDAGPASRWARDCAPGDPAVIIDEGITVPPADPGSEHLFITEESGVPAVLGILRSLPRDATGTALLEIPTSGDIQPDEAPDGVAVRWIVRPDPHATPGVAVLSALEATTFDAERVRVFTVGEQALPTGARRALVARGVAKDRIVFCGYWRVNRASY